MTSNFIDENSLSEWKGKIKTGFPTVPIYQFYGQLSNMSDMSEAKPFNESNVLLRGATLTNTGLFFIINFIFFIYYFIFIFLFIFYFLFFIFYFLFLFHSYLFFKTEWVFAIVLYTGDDSKIVLNSL